MAVFNVGLRGYGRRIETGRPVFWVLKLGRLTFTFALANTYRPLA